MAAQTAALSWFGQRISSRFMFLFPAKTLLKDWEAIQNSFCEDIKGRMGRINKKRNNKWNKWAEGESGSTIVGGLGFKVRLTGLSQNKTSLPVCCSWIIKGGRDRCLSMHHKGTGAFWEAVQSGQQMTPCSVDVGLKGLNSVLIFRFSVYFHFKCQGVHSNAHEQEFFNTLQGSHSHQIYMYILNM